MSCIVGFECISKLINVTLKQVDVLKYEFTDQQITQKTIPSINDEISFSFSHMEGLNNFFFKTITYVV